jgi:hypothetical protein
VDDTFSFVAHAKYWKTGAHSQETRVVESGDNGGRRLGPADFSAADSRQK